MLTLNDCLYSEKYAEIKIFEVINFDAAYRVWEVEPIESDVLSPPRVSDSFGHFVLKAFLIKTKDAVENCYVDVLLPERISENVYLWIDGALIEKNKWELGAEMVPQVSVNFFGDYELYYSRQMPDLGIKVLKHGLTLVENKFAIALDLAYILRDEGQHEESISAFSIAIDEDATNYFLFIERAQLLDKIGKRELANRDWKVVEKLAGAEVLEMYRRNDD